MKKVLLVDDEIVIRENIRNCVDWEGEGFLYCGDASDGELALPMIEQWKPDILITDIKMPFLDGLELSRIVRKRMPDMKIVILSGHDEFDYARAAMRIGVTEYCLKPVSSSELVGILHAVSHSIDADRREKERLHLLRQQESSNSALTRDKLLGDVCRGLITTVDALQLASELSVPLTANYYAVVITDIRNGEDRLIPVDHGAIEQAEDRFQRMLEAMTPFLDFKSSRTERAWILKHESAERLTELLERIPGLIRGEVERECGCRLNFGIGSVQDRVQHLHASFLEADEDRHWRRWSAQNLKLIRSSDAAGEHPYFADRLRYIEFLKIGSPAEAGAFIAEWAEGLRGMDWRNDLYGFYLLNNLTIETIQAAKAIYRHLDGMDPAFQHLQDMLADVSSWEKAVQYLGRLAELFWQWRSGASGRYADVIRQVKDYIGRNFAQDQLSLQDVADYVKISPSHLSKVFSQETGQTFIEYLTHIRIRKAMELLQTTSDKSYAIAHQVGYNDAHYFSNLFKKITGKTTTDFRKEGRTETSMPALEDEPCARPLAN